MCVSCACHVCVVCAGCVFVDDWDLRGMKWVSERVLAGEGTGEAGPGRTTHRMWSETIALPGARETVGRRIEAVGRLWVLVQCMCVCVCVCRAHAYLLRATQSNQTDIVFHKLEAELALDDPR